MSGEFGPKDDASRQQMALVMLTTGTPEQRLEAAEYLGLIPRVEKSNPTDDKKLKLQREFYRAIFAVRRLCFQVMERFVLKEEKAIPFDLNTMIGNLNSAVTIFNELITTYSKTDEEVKDIDVHTEHCCKLCGCKYGDDIKDDDGFVGCSVTSSRKKQTRPCKGECSFHF